MRKLLLLLTLLPTLAACGADGAPERPTAQPGLTLSGSVEAGIARNGS